MKKIIALLIVFVIVLVNIVSVFAIDDFINTDGFKLPIKEGIIEKGNSFQLKFDIDTDTKRIEIDASSYNFRFELDGNLLEITEAGVELTPVLRKGTHSINITANEQLKIERIEFLRVPLRTGINKHTPIEYTKEEDLLQTAILIKENSPIAIVRNANRYIGEHKRDVVPEYIEDSLYLPCEFLAKILFCYYEELENGSCLISDNTTEIMVHTKNASIRNICEKFGYIVLYDRGLIIIDKSALRAKSIAFENREYIDKKYADFGSTVNGQTYFVAQTINASDSNDGSEEYPFRTINHAAQIAKAGDNVLIDSGTYRETVIPKNDGTPLAPITFVAKDGAKVVISANDMLTNVAEYKEAQYVAKMDWDLGKGKNMLFINGEVVAEARHPNTHNSKRYYPYELNLSKLWPTQGDIIVYNTAPGKAVSKTSLDYPKDFWKDSIYVGLQYAGWSLSTALVSGSNKGEVELTNKTGQWFFAGDPSLSPDWTTYDSDYGYIVGSYNAIDVPGEWARKGDNLFFIPPTGIDMKKSTVEAKKRLLTVDLTNKKSIHIKNIESIGGSLNFKDSDFCVIDECKLRYVSHFTMISSAREGFLDGRTDPNSNSIVDGEVGINFDGSNNVIVNSVVDHSAGAGLIISGKYAYIKNNVISNCGYMGSYLGGLFITAKLGTKYSDLRGGHSICNNSIYNSGRSPLLWQSPILTDGNTAKTPYVPYIAMEVAYNDIYNGGVLSGRDGGMVNSYYVTLGNDRIMSKVHHNLVWDSYVIDYNYLGKSFSANIYYDAGTQMIESYNNMSFSTSEETTTKWPYLSNHNDKLPDWINIVYDWGRKDLGLKLGGKEALTVGDYPYGKPFISGSGIDENLKKVIKNKPTVDDTNWILAKDSESVVGTKDLDGFVTATEDGDYIKFNDVDFGEGANSLAMCVKGDLYNTNDKIQISIDDPKNIVSTIRYKSEANNIDGVNEINMNFNTYAGTHDVFVKFTVYKSAMLEKIRFYHMDIPDSDVVCKLELEDYTTAGHREPLLEGTSPLKTHIVQDPETSFMHDTWAGNWALYEAVGLFASEVSALTIKYATQTPFADNIIKIRLGAVDAEPVGEILLESTGWDTYVEKTITLDKPIPVGQYDIYLTFEGEGKSSNITWLKFNK